MRVGCARHSHRDQHGQKRNQPEELVNEFHERHKEDFAGFEISFDEFYTTDSPENRRHCEIIYLRAQEKGHISTREIEQYYCEVCGRFLPDRYIKGTCPKCGAPDQYGDVCEVCGATYRPTEVIDAKCAICGAPPSLRTSKHFFFQLKDFNDFLSQWIAEPGHLQDEVRAFVGTWMDQGLQDWDISRDGPYFGFKIPGEQDKYFYVWLDAPIGYIAATEHYCASHGNCKAEDYWLDPAADVEIHHFIGKDIAYFHTLFWPAVLSAADYRIPTAVHVHGFLTVDGRKMSKSRGTFITAREFASFLNPWYLRYYYSTKMSNSIDDLDLNIEEFVNRTNAELVNNITNLISRTVGFLNKRLESRLGTLPEAAHELMNEVGAFVDRARDDYAELRFNQATRNILSISDIANNYVQQNAPWAVIKNDPEQARNDLTFAVNCIKIITVLLKPVLPSYCRRVEEILRLGNMTWEDAKFDLQNAEIGTFDKLLERLEPGALEKLVELGREGGIKKEAPPLPEVPPFKDEITIEDFAGMDIRAAKVKSAETIEGSDKLLKLEVDLGRENRTVFAGIKGHYEPSDLIGRTVLVIANLKPRKMRFGVSHGMILAAADKNGKVAICEVDSSIPEGTPIK